MLLGINGRLSKCTNIVQSVFEATTVQQNGWWFVRSFESTVASLHRCIVASFVSLCRLWCRCFHCLLSRAGSSAKKSNRAEHDLRMLRSLDHWRGTDNVVVGAVCVCVWVGGGGGQCNARV